MKTSHAFQNAVRRVPAEEPVHGERAPGERHVRPERLEVVLVPVEVRVRVRPEEAWHDEADEIAPLDVRAVEEDLVGYRRAPLRAVREIEWHPARGGDGEAAGEGRRAGEEALSVEAQPTPSPGSGHSIAR